jgi:hypothetical protein
MIGVVCHRTPEAVRVSEAESGEPTVIPVSQCTTMSVLHCRSSSSIVRDGDRAGDELDRRRDVAAGGDIDKAADTKIQILRHVLGDDGQRNQSRREQN